MIITWFTDPSNGTFTEGSGKFSSYYQYDTTTRKFVRVRLELGRGTTDSDDGGTNAFFDEERYVGFTSKDFMDETEYPDSAFKFDPKTGQVLVKDEPLKTKPSIGDNVIDMSPDSTEPHFGNQVSDKVFLPEGIEPKHLNLIANEAIIQERDIELTAKNVTGLELSAKIKGEVSRIVNKDFNEITNDDILEKLKSQVKQIKEESVEPAKKSIKGSLEEVDKQLEEIGESFTEKGVVPTEDFEEAFKQLQTKVSEAKSAVGSGKGVKKAISELAEAKTALNTAAKDINQDHYEELKDSFTRSEEAIESAQIESQKWEDIAAEYQKVEEATSLEEYEESIGNTEEVEIK